MAKGRETMPTPLTLTELATIADRAYCYAGDPPKGICPRAWHEASWQLARRATDLMDMIKPRGK